MKVYAEKVAVDAEKVAEIHDWQFVKNNPGIYRPCSANGDVYWDEDEWLITLDNDVGNEYAIVYYHAIGNILESAAEDYWCERKFIAVEKKIQFAIF